MIAQKNCMGMICQTKTFQRPELHAKSYIIHVLTK